MNVGPLVDVNRSPKGRCGRLRRKPYYALRVHVHGMRRAYNNREIAKKFAARQKRSPFARSTKVEQTGRRSLTNYLVLWYTLLREPSANPSGDLVFYADQFHTVEVNLTFYACPTLRSNAAARTPEKKSHRPSPMKKSWWTAMRNGKNFSRLWTFSVQSWGQWSFNSR